MLLTNLNCFVYRLDYWRLKPFESIVYNLLKPQIYAV